MSINSSFLAYFESEFFHNDPTEFETFKKSLLRPLKKTIRLNPARLGRIDANGTADFSEFITAKTLDGWTFSPTPNGHVFHVDRSDTSLALGSTLEHLRGDFYIQELSASMSVWHLAWGRVHQENLSILEMAASPGGKTTQLAEHYPNSIIIANEFAKDRMNALIENIERMGNDTVLVTNVNGVQFWGLPETFDRVLLDAPCSGEGIGFKAEQSLRYWNIKNVRTIARLQSKLLKAGLEALKVGWTLLYSTCTLNKLENEWVLESAKEAFGDAIEITFAKRFWPHKEVAWGFFVAKIEKRRSFDALKRIPMQSNTDLLQVEGRDREQLLAELAKLWFIPGENHIFYRYRNDILLIRSHPDLHTLTKELYIIRFGMRIGRMEHATFIPNHALWANFILSAIPHISLQAEEVDRYLSGMELSIKGHEQDGYVQLFANHSPLGLSEVEWGRVKNQFPKNWLRK